MLIHLRLKQATVKIMPQQHFCSHLFLLYTGERTINVPVKHAGTHHQQLLRKLGKEQKILSRRVLVAKKAGRKLLESKNYQKQCLKTAKIHENIANKRRDFLNKISAEFVLYRLIIHV